MSDSASTPTSSLPSRPQQSAPKWQSNAEAPNCNKCKASFSLFVRRHHCRYCGKIFCEECSAKTCSIPQFDMPKPVRVCDDCFVTIKRTNFDFNI